MCVYESVVVCVCVCVCVCMSVCVCACEWVHECVSVLCALLRECVWCVCVCGVHGRHLMKKEKYLSFCDTRVGLHPLRLC